MTDTVTSLSRPTRRVPQLAAGNGVPRGGDKRSAEVRSNLAEYLDSQFLIPGYSGQEKAEFIDQSLHAMTPAERTFIEIEMTERAKSFHTFDYDPIWGRR
jgi:hypothetical protein